ncbi:MAG: UPF0176 protein [Gammaproteobacteria bacterium]|jgi:UPF0176 protein
MPSIVVAALYRFVALPDFKALRQPLLDHLLKNEIRGTVLLASEGLNGTVAGTESAIHQLLEYLRKDDRLRDLDAKFSTTEEMPFYRSRVKLKKEIVTMGVEGIDPQRSVGTYVKPSEWNALISDPDVIIIDTRNDYETAIGSFKNAIIPNTKSFRDFPAFANEHLDLNKTPKVAMFCTGGIRCEKSTAYLKEQGFEEVFHLKGGILKYLEEVPQADSLWQGECFVFDNRVSVNHDLDKGSYDQCHACRLPITESDKQHFHYQAGVSCPNCYSGKTETERQRFREREKQMKLAEERGETHIGQSVRIDADKRRQLKLKNKNQQRDKSNST